MSVEEIANTCVTEWIKSLRYSFSCEYNRVFVITSLACSSSEKIDPKANSVSKLTLWGKPVETINARDFASPELFRVRAMELKNYPKAAHPHRQLGTGKLISIELIQ